MSLPQYATYSSTGMDVPAMAPSHWSISRLRFLAQLNPSKSEIADIPVTTPVTFLPMEAIGEDGSVSLEQVREIADVQTGYTYMRDGDVAFAKITPCFENGKGAVVRGLLNGIAFGTTELIVARPRRGVLRAEYLHYVFTSRDFRQLGEARMYGAGGQKRVPDAFVRDFAWPYPSTDEQVQIVVFLDRETAKIDALVAEQERLMALLREKRQAVISHAVTKGVNPAAAFLASGVRWLGDIPAHWGVGQSRRRFRLRNEPARADDRQLTASQKHGVILQEEFMRLEDQRVVQVIKGADILKHVEPNDFVISMRSFQGGIERSLERGCISSAYVMLCPDETIHGPFFAYLFKSRSYIQALQATSNLVRDGQALRFDNFAQVDLPLVPIEEQVEIARFLDDETRRIDDLIEVSSVGVGLLLERRAALVTAAVTGQIDVRHLANADAA